MAIVDGFTAERMLEIEQTTVVDGHVDSAGELILETRDGTELAPAGYVKGTRWGTTHFWVWADGTNIEVIFEDGLPPKIGDLIVSDNLFDPGRVSVVTAVVDATHVDASETDLSIRGPQGPAGTPAVTNRLYSSASTATTNLIHATVTIVPTWSFVEGDSSLITGSTSAGNFTIAEAGMYQVSFSVTHGNNVDGRRIALVYKNGVEIRRTDVGSGGLSTVEVNETLLCSVGTVLTFRAYQSSGGALALGAAPGHDVRIVKLA